MSLSFDNGTGAFTVPAGGATKAFPVRDMVWATDWRVKQNQPSEILLTAARASVDRPAEIRVAVSAVKDVYDKSDIDPSHRSPYRRGLTILSQFRNVFTLTDSANPLSSVYLPVSAHLVIRIPILEQITSDVVKDAIIANVVGALFESTSVNGDRISDLMHGVLAPRPLQ